MRYVIFGSGGLAKELIGYLYGKHDIACVVSTEPFNNFEFARQFKVVPKLHRGEHPDAAFLLGVAQPEVKRKIVAENEDRWATFIHPTATVSPFATIGRGCILTPQTIVVGDAVLGDFVFMNTNATVGHDAVIGDYTTMFPNTEVCGNCTLGQDVIMGIGSYVIPNVALPSKTKVSAGAIVRKSIDTPTTLYGDPAKPR